MSKTPNLAPNDLSSFWMPFTANRQFKANPRMFVSAKDMHYTTDDGRQILDGTAGLWCVNAGHSRPKIVKAIQNQVAELDYAPAFQMGHPKAFELANRIAAISPEGMDHVFYTNSGSESVETALKIALAYHKLNGDGGRTRLIGRERGYHGVNFGGTSVGGMVANRKMFGNLLTGVDHLPHTHLPEKNAFSKGQPKHGAELAEELERITLLHDPSTIAAVIIEAVAGSAGVLIPPVGYLEQIRKLCDQYGILLILDEVITGFGRLGAPFASDYFGVIPDIMTTAKGLTSGIIPMGAVVVQNNIHKAFMQGPDQTIEFFHGYTYSGNPVATAAALATLETYEDEQLLTRASKLENYWQKKLHKLRDCPYVIDIRNIGLIGAIELQPIQDSPTKRAYSVFLKAFEKGCLIRATGDTIALSPPLIISEDQIDELIECIREAINEID